MIIVTIVTTGSPMINVTEAKLFALLNCRYSANNAGVAGRLFNPLLVVAL